MPRAAQVSEQLSEWTLCSNRVLYALFSHKSSALSCHLSLAEWCPYEVVTTLGPLSMFWVFPACPVVTYWTIAERITISWETEGISWASLCVLLYMRLHASSEAMSTDIILGSLWARSGLAGGDVSWRSGAVLLLWQSLLRCSLCLTFCVDTWAQGLLTLCLQEMFLLSPSVLTPLLSPFLRSSNISLG